MCNCIVRSIGSSSIYILDIIGVVIYWKSKMLSLGAFSQKFLLPNYLTTRYIFFREVLRSRRSSNKSGKLERTEIYRYI